MESSGVETRTWPITILMKHFQTWQNSKGTVNPLITD